jgi:ABC-type transport system involved in multi-copper enzyme maturation permease subunit
VNWTLIGSFWLQRSRSPVRMILLAMVVTFAAGRTAMLPMAWQLGVNDAWTVAAILGFGMISQDVSSGAAQLILVRPVRRVEYLLSRCMAVLLGAMMVLGLQLGIALVIATARGIAPLASDILANALMAMSWIVGVTAIIALLTSVARGLGDLGLYAMILAATGFFGFAGQVARLEWAKWIATALGWFVNVGISTEDFAAAGPEMWKGLLQLAITAVACFAMGYAALRRRELTYSN